MTTEILDRYRRHNISTHVSTLLTKLRLVNKSTDCFGSYDYVMLGFKKQQKKTYSIVKINKPYATRHILTLPLELLRILFCYAFASVTWPGHVILNYNLRINEELSSPLNFHYLFVSTGLLVDARLHSAPATCLLVASTHTPIMSPLDPACIRYSWSIHRVYWLPSALPSSIASYCSSACQTQIRRTTEIWVWGTRRAVGGDAGWSALATSTLDVMDQLYRIQAGSKGNILACVYWATSKHVAGAECSRASTANQWTRRGSGSWEEKKFFVDSKIIIKDHVTGSGDWRECVQNKIRTTRGGVLNIWRVAYGLFIFTILYVFFCCFLKPNIT